LLESYRPETHTQLTDCSIWTTKWSVSVADLGRVPCDEGSLEENQQSKVRKIWNLHFTMKIW